MAFGHDVLRFLLTYMYVLLEAQQRGLYHESLESKQATTKIILQYEDDDDIYTFYLNANIGPCL